MRNISREWTHQALLSLAFISKQDVCFSPTGLSMLRFTAGSLQALALDKQSRDCCDCTQQGRQGKRPADSFKVHQASCHLDIGWQVVYRRNGMSNFINHLKESARGSGQPESQTSTFQSKREFDRFYFPFIWYSTQGLCKA
jgi:hypothetical protein